MYSYRYYGHEEVYCGQYFSDSYLTGLVDANGNSINIPTAQNGYKNKVCKVEHQKCPCDLKITADKQIIDPYTGGILDIKGTIRDSSGKPITWNVQLPNGQDAPGIGPEIRAHWDGTDGDGKLVKAGATYNAVITAQNSDGCTDQMSVPIRVMSSDKICGLQVQIGSSAQVANGNLSHSQELFSSRGSALPLSMDLHYNSRDPVNGALGRGWSHDYDIALTENSDGSVLLEEGNWRMRLYTPSGSGYVAQPDDYSTLVRNADTSFTLTHRDGSKYAFNTDGKIAAISDRNSNSVTFAYSGGRLTTITDPSGRSASFTHDADGRITGITDPAGKGYTLGYSGGTISNITYPDGGAWLFTYDDKAFLLTKTDPLGNTTTYTYDEKHRIVSATDSEGKTRTLTYPVGSDTVKTTTFTEKDGGVWQYTYDTEKGTLNRKTDPQGGTTGYTYDTKGNRLSTTGPDGAVTSYTYDAFGNMTSSTDPLGQTTSYTYNGFGQVTTVTDPQGSTTTSGYDEKGNLTQTTDAAGAVTRYEYDGTGNLTRVITPLGQTTTLAYDTSGNLASVTDATGAKTSYTYDASGNMITMTDSLGAVTRYEYNAKNRLVKTIDPNGNITISSYDLAGNRISETDANGNTTTYEYNAKGQVIKTKDALGNVTVYTYGGSGCASCGGGTDKLTALTDANGNFTAYQYDTLGRLVKETDPLGNATSYSYDIKGNLASKTDANGSVISYSYDGNGRLLKKSYPDAGEESFTYDAKGNILTATNRNISYTFAYDTNNMMVSTTDSSNRTVRYDYDLGGRKTKLTYPDGSFVNYGYDTAGRLATLTDEDGKSFTFAYDSLGRRTKLSSPNGTTARYSYDSAGRLTSLIHRNSRNKIIDSFSYTLDKVGNRLSRTEPDGKTSYTYDLIYRLLSAATGMKSHHASTESFTYDPVGNRLTGPEKKLSYQYNQGNQLVGQSIKQGHCNNSGIRYTYDKNGNLISKEEPRGHSTTTTLYTYDYENRLITVALQQGNKAKVVSFAYDPFGRRLSKSVQREELEEDDDHGKGHDDCDDDRHAPRTTYYLYDNEDIILEYDDRGEVLTRYTHGPGTDEPLAMERKGKVYHFHADGLGSIMALTDRHGNAIRKYGYDSFGNMTQEQREFSQPYAYTGREWDKETGLYYYRARYYDPEVGRFIQKDPIGFAGGDVNLYGYTSNNPITRTDPTGLDSARARVIALILKGNLGEALVIAEAAGLTIANKINQVIEEINALIRRFPLDSGKCEKLAELISKAFQRIGANPQIHKITPCGRHLVVIGNRGWGEHYIVRVGGKVFDAFTGAGGMSIAEYKQMLDVANGAGTYSGI